MITNFDKKVIRENLSEIEQIEDYLFKLTAGRNESVLADIWSDLYDLLEEYRYYINIE